MSESETADLHRGGCLCGALRYAVRGPLRPVIACHCGQCRRTSGHYAAATAAARSDLEVGKAAALSWYESSPGIRRGFCAICGSSLFWDDAARGYIAIFAGSLDRPSGLDLAAHIFVADKGDYYEIGDDLPQFPAYSQTVWER